MTGVFMKNVVVLCCLLVVPLAADDTELSVLQELRALAVADAAQQERVVFLLQVGALGLGYGLGGATMLLILSTLRRKDFN